MRLLDKMERKFGRFAIKGLMIHIVALNALVYMLKFIQDEKLGFFIDFFSKRIYT
jgi:hypothetical protein